ncbi:MAG: hypothetical protein KAR73_00485 [Spirochaetales bacterium]|nr:hypothetical protein [Spirochaetales bacterium]
MGRPASGKSEIIDYLGKLDPDQRRSRFHLGELEVVDDFPMLWAWFEEDKLLAEMGKPPLHTGGDGYFKEDYLWDLLIRRLCLEYKKRKTEDPSLHEGSTVIIEFSRGSEHGGYRRAFEQMSVDVLEAAAVLYLQVSFEESLRKNHKRFNPEAPHSILEHSLPEAKMKRLYGIDDWSELSRSDSRFLLLKDLKIPYSVFENEADFTTTGGEELGRRLAGCFEALWRIYRT